MATALDQLVVRIDANAERFERGMRGARQSIDRFGRQVDQRMSRVERRFDSVGASITRAMRGFIPILSAGILIRAGREAIQFADQIGVAADRIGVTAEALQEFRFAAEDAANLGINQADIALQRFTRRVGEAQAGTGELLPIIEQYGIALTNADGSTRSITEVLRDYADVVANAGSEQEQLRLAFKAFDSEGAALVNVLRQGADGMDQFASEAREAGILTNETVAEAQELDAELTRLSQTLGTSLAEAFIALGPIISGFVQALAFTAQTVRDFIVYLDEISAPRGGAAGGIARDMVLRAQGVRRELDAINDRYSDTSGAFAESQRAAEIAALEEELIAINAVVTAYGDLPEFRREYIDAGGSEDDLPVLDDPDRPTFEPGVPPPIAGGGGSSSTDDATRRLQAVEALITAQSRETAMLRVRAETLAQGNTEQARANELATAWFTSLGENAQGVEGLASTLQEMAGTQIAYADRLQLMEDANNLVNEAVAQGIDQTELYEQALAILQARLEAGTITAEQFAAAQEHINSQGEDLPDWANSAAGAITNAFGSMVSGAASAEEALSNLAFRLAEMIIQITILQPLAEALSQTLSGIGGGGGGSLFDNLFGGGGGGKPSIGKPSIGKFGGFKAGGGPVYPGNWYMVGENGPEPFVPNVPGQIIPNGSMRVGAGGAPSSVSVPITINAPGADPRQLELVRREVEGIKRDLPGIIVNVTGEGQRNRRLR